MKFVTNSNVLETQAEQAVLSSPGHNIRGLFMKLGKNLRKAYRFWDEMTTPPRHLPRTVLPRTWRRHSALLSCWEEQYRKSES